MILGINGIAGFTKKGKVCSIIGKTAAGKMNKKNFVRKSFQMSQMHVRPQSALALVLLLKPLLMLVLRLNCFQIKQNKKTSLI